MSPELLLAPLPPPCWFLIKTCFVHYAGLKWVEGLLMERAGAKAERAWGGMNRGCSMGSVCMALRQKHPH